MNDDTPDLDAEFASDEGEVLTGENIGYLVRYENAEVENVDRGYVVNGVFYRCVSSEERR